MSTAPRRKLQGPCTACGSETTCSSRQTWHRRGNHILCGACETSHSRHGEVRLRTRMTAPSVQTQRRGSTRPPSISDEESGTPSPKPKPRPKPKPKFKQPAQTTILHLDEPQHLPRIPQTVRRRVVKLVQDSGLSLTSEVQQVLHGVIPASCSGLYLALDTAEKRTPEKN